MTFQTVLGAIAALLRRPGVRRLLVVAGVLAAGWLLGGATAQAAHADTPPPDNGVVGVVEQAPVIGDAIRASKQVTGAVPHVNLPALPVAGPLGNVPSVPGDAPSAPRPADRPAAPATPSVTHTAHGSATRGERGHGMVAAARGATTRPTKARHVPAHTRSTTGKHTAPDGSNPAPAPAGTGMPGTSPLPFDGFGGPLARHFGLRPRTPALPAHAPCVLPPVVRTAADEPSFAPD
jgi:hypothetical protein